MSAPHHHREDCRGHEPAREAIALHEVADAHETVLAVSGMDCGEEVAAIERVLRPIAGVGQMRVDLIAGRVTISHEAGVTPEELIAAIARAGLTARLPDGAGPSEHDTANRMRSVAVLTSGALTGVGLALQWTGSPAPGAEPFVFGAAIVAGGWFIFPKALAAARQLAPDMNLLMLVAVAGAACIGQWSEGAAVTFLFGLSETLEAFSVARARRAIASLLALTPLVASRIRGDRVEEVPVEQVRVGETLAVKSGQRVPLDGEVTAGSSAVNQAPITGESLPVEKKIGDAVYAGTINGEGALEVRVTKAAGDTMIARIAKLVGEAQAQKAPAQRFVDVFARYYTPAVMVLALLVFLVPPLLAGGAWGMWFYRALVLLVIACPCALVIATPVSIVSGLTAMSRRGVLIKGGAHLEAVGKLRALAVDKTGTITEGRPRVLSARALNGKTEAEVLRVAAAIDAHSEHPLARAVVAYARETGVAASRAESYTARTGRGAEGVVDGHAYFVGNHRFTHELGVCSPEIERDLAAIEGQGQSVIVVGHRPHDGCAGEVIGIMAVGDVIRPNAAAAVRALHAAGLRKIVMLSGDNQRTADAIARQAGIDEAYGDLLPEDKIGRIHLLLARYHHVGMIGDGVNDAPAMAAATIGIAMGKAGTDTAIETADMALMQDDLGRVADAIRLGRRTVRIIQFNIVFALLVKAVFLVLALSGHTSLWLAIAADTGATLLVVMNALRLLRP